MTDRIKVLTNKKFILKGVEVDLGPDPVFATLTVAFPGSDPVLYDLRVPLAVAVESTHLIGEKIWLEISVIPCEEQHG